MPMKRYKPGQIVSLRRQIEVEIANGKTTQQACKEAEITVQTFHSLAERVRWPEAGSSQASGATITYHMNRLQSRLMAP